MAKTPTILLAYPSSFYSSTGIDDVDIKTSLLVLGSYLSPYFPVTYMDFEVAVGRPNSPIQIRRFERHVREYFEHHEYDILGVSCWTSMSYSASMLVARIYREMYPDKLITVGGYHPMARPVDFVTQDRLFDYVVCGEGEQAFRQIVENYGASGRPAQTTVVQGTTAGSDQFVPYQWELVDSFVHAHFPAGLPKMYVYLSRGCPFDCSFCMEALKERRWRPLTPSQAIEQIQSAVERYGSKIVGIADACFGLRPTWRKEFLRLLVDSHPTFQTIFETRAEYLDEDDIELLAQIPVEIQFGVESCSPSMLKLMRKTKVPEKYLDRFFRTSRALSVHKVLHRANMIFNHPGETRQTLSESFAFMDRLLETPESYLMWICRAYMHYPGCELDRNHTYYEQTFGTEFRCAEWWREDRDQYLASLDSTPSAELAGSDGELWGRLLTQREERFRTGLAPMAFRYAAEKYFPEWLDDPRYKQV
jgi:radical SAM superfamily enzyme YgiQ (UPF0313 family)